MTTKFWILVLLLLTQACTFAAPDEQENDMSLDNVVCAWSSPAKIRPGSQGQAGLLQAQFPEAGNYTVQFSVVDPNANLALGNRVLLRAEITWIVRGNFVRRVVDVASGVSVSGTAEGVNVHVFDASTITGQAQDVSVSLQVVKGTRPSVGQPPRFWLQDVAIGPGIDQEVIVIPDDIGAISIFTSIRPNTVGDSIGAYDIVEFQAATAGGSVVLNSYDPRQTDWVPLVGGSRSIVLQTSAAAPLLVATLILGIDG